MTTETLAPREAYRLWAATYDVETAMNALDEGAVAALSPKHFRRLLDAACGTGRRIPAGAPNGARAAFGVDLVPEMLAVARRRSGLAGLLAAGDLAALPYLSGAFDLVWCRLALGHVGDLDRAYAELARVTAADGAVVITDVHPEAALRGLRRTFRGEDGVTRGVIHHAHTAASHARAAERAGLAIEERLEPVIGPGIERFFRAANALESYEAQRGLPVLLALRLARRA